MSYSQAVIGIGGVALFLASLLSNAVPEIGPKDASILDCRDRGQIVEVDKQDGNILVMRCVDP